MRARWRLQALGAEGGQPPATLCLKGRLGLGGSRHLVQWVVCFLKSGSYLCPAPPRGPCTAGKSRHVHARCPLFPPGALLSAGHRRGAAGQRPPSRGCRAGRDHGGNRRLCQAAEPSAAHRAEPHHRAGPCFPHAGACWLGILTPLSGSHQYWNGQEGGRELDSGMPCTHRCAPEPADAQTLARK